MSLLNSVGPHVDLLSFSSLFSSALPSYLNIRSTNPNDTDISTRDTITMMNHHSLVDSRHPIVRGVAEDILDKVADQGDDFELIEATYDWVKENVTFVEDEQLLKQMFGIDKGVELLIEPARLLSMHRPMGDCDDFSMLIKALLLNFDIDSDFVTVAADREHPRKWSHVYNLAMLSDGKPQFIDASHGKYLGWEAPNANRKVVWKRVR